MMGSRPRGVVVAAFPFYLSGSLVLLLYYCSFGICLPRAVLPAASHLKACLESSPYPLLFKAASLIPASHYALAFFLTLLVFLYHFLEIHLLHDLFSTGFRGDPVRLSFNPRSALYESVVSKCRILQGRYLATPWLASPHLQTAFLGYVAGNPVFSYNREVFRTPDGGTIALDWLRNASDANFIDKRIPIVMVVPGITSDSESSYIKHLAFKITKRAWNVCVVNHRGFGGVLITSDNFHNGGWTKDIREVTSYLHSEYSQAPIYGVGISVGGNILVKYLGEDGINAPVVGAAVIGSPWDNLLVDRFMNRTFLQKLYNKAIASSLKRYAERHQLVFSRVANMEGARKSSLLREFDRYITSPLGKFKTVDSYYRDSSSVNFVGSVSVPLLAISALDDPVCPAEAIPWDECWENENIVLATTLHGGHVAYYEGIMANSLWWVRAVDEFLGVLDSRQLEGRKQVLIE